MKLYTKEMFLTAAEKCEVSMIDAQHIMRYIDEYVTPIELPSDEEVDELFPKTNTLYEALGRSGMIEGAKWMRDKIQGGDQ
jgi:hypothetical protein